MRATSSIIFLTKAAIFAMSIQSSSALSALTIDQAWDYSDPVTSESNFRAMLKEQKPDAWRAEVMTQLARSLGLQRKFNEAQKVLDEAQSMINSDMQVALVRWHLEQGRVINSRGDAAGSIANFEQSLQLAQQAGAEYLAIDAAHMLGIVETSEKAIGWNEKALQMAESAKDPKSRGWLGPLYNNLAWTYSDRGEYERALELFTKDVAYRESIGRTFEASIALWSRAKTLRFLGRVEEALQIQRGLLSHPDRHGKPAEGYTNEEIGECLILLNREAESKPHFAIAHEILSGDPWMVANEAERLQRLKKLGGS